MIYITFQKSFFYSELCMNFSVTSDPPTDLQPCDITVMVGLTLQSRFQCVVHFIPLHRFLHTQMPKTDLVFLLSQENRKMSQNMKKWGKK